MEDPSIGKKSKIIWTKGLSKKFVEAIGKLGIDNASPKKILEIMNVDGLTRDHVSSHLQKYRISLKKRTNACNDIHSASKQYMLKSPMVNATSLENSSYMRDPEQMKRASYSEMHTTNLQPTDNSHSCFPFFEAAKFNATTSSAFTHTVHEEEILKGFQSEDKFFLVKGATQDAVRNVSDHAYQYNKKSSDAKSCREENEMNSSSKSASVIKDNCSGTKSKVIWTEDLKEKFLEAIGKLGIDNASPKKIQELMKVDGLTRDHVASFLQKYRILLKKLATTSYNVQAAPKPYLLESSKVLNGTSFTKSSMTVDQVQKNWPSHIRMHTSNPARVDASSSCFPFLEDTNFNAASSSSLMRSEWDGNMENVTAEDNLVLNETDIASLFSSSDDNVDN